MKRLTTACFLALALPSAALADDVRVTLRGAFDGEQVFRGTNLAEETVSGSIEISVPQRAREFYGGVAMELPTSQPDGLFDFSNEYRLFIGAAFNGFDRGVWIDVGYTQYLYDDDGPALFQNGQERGEFHFGGFIDVELLDRDFTPSAFFFYDIEREELTFEADIQYSHLIGPNLYIDLGGHAGAVLTAGGTEHLVEGGVLVERSIEEYAYYGLEADLRFDFSGRAEAFAGARAAGATEDRFIDGFAPGTGLPRSFTDGAAWLTAGLRLDF